MTIFFYRYNEGDIVIDSNNSIYVNSYSDIKKALSSLIAEENDFTAEDLLLLYQTGDQSQSEDDKITKLESEVERLWKIIKDLTEVSGRAKSDVTTMSDKYLTSLSKTGEEYLFKILNELYPSEKIRWLNFNQETKEFEESWEDHDFEIISKNGKILHFIECKATAQNKTTFYLSIHEWKFFLSCVQKGMSYQIYRIYNLKENPNHIHIDNLLEWIISGKVVPYLPATEIIRGGTVYLTIK